MMIPALAAAAALAPAAMAKVDGSEGGALPAPVVVPYLSHGILTPLQAAQVAPVTSADDRAFARVLGEPTVVQAPQAVSGDGFDWGSAGIGAGSALAASVFAGGLLYMSRRRTGGLAGA